MRAGARTIYIYNLSHESDSLFKYSDEIKSIYANAHFRIKYSEDKSWKEHIQMESSSWNNKQCELEPFKIGITSISKTVLNVIHSFWSIWLVCKSSVADRHNSLDIWISPNWLIRPEWIAEDKVSLIQSHRSGNPIQFRPNEPFSLITLNPRQYGLLNILR